MTRILDPFACRAWMILLLIGGLIIEPIFLHPGLSAGQTQDARSDTSRLGLLDWGNNPATGKAWTMTDLKQLAQASAHSSVGKEVRNILRSAHKELEKAGTVEPIERIEMEGVLSTEDRYQSSIKAARVFPAMISWAFCARLEACDATANRCKTALLEGLFGKDGNQGWLGIYKPTGNPIDESNLLPLIQAIDLARPLFTKAQAEKVQAFLKNMIDQGDRFFAAKKPGSTSRINNHNTWRLTVRAAAAKGLNDPVLLSTRDLFARQVIDDLLPPSGWRPDSACPNNAGEKRYGSYDFRQRDALHYHVYNLEAFVFAATFTPDVLGQSERRAISEALDFLRPYFVGEKTHREFVCSSVRFDYERSAAGIEEYSKHPWKPERARKLLRVARPVFPEIGPWTASIVDEKYSPTLKLTAALHGEGR